jgi:purine-cytosine permease-like protein
MTYDITQPVHNHYRMVTFIIFMMIFGLGGHAGYHPEAQKPNEDRGIDYSADLLTFGGIIFSSCSGWAPVAADYNVRLPADINPLCTLLVPLSQAIDHSNSLTDVFVLTWLGLFIPIVLIVSLGATLMTITNEAYVNAFADGGTGGLLAQVLSPWGGFGKFLLVLLALSVIANNM